MATYTKSLGLTKPEMTDSITPIIFAENFEKIDDAFASVAMKSDLTPYATTVALDSAVSSLQQQIDGVATALDAINGEVK